MNAPLTVGSVAVLWLGGFDNSVVVTPSSTVTGGGTWTARDQTTLPIGSGNSRVEVWTCKVTSSTATITIPFTGGLTAWEVNADVIEISGLASAVPESLPAPVGYNTTGLKTVTVTASSPNSMLLGLCLDGLTAGSAPTPGSGYTGWLEVFPATWSDANDMPLGFEWRIAGQKGSNTVTFTKNSAAVATLYGLSFAPGDVITSSNQWRIVVG